jgi:ADP-ribosyl-[dinitrogen reductase] hydrolase
MAGKSELRRLCARVLEQTDKNPLAITPQSRNDPLCGFSIFRNVDAELKAQLLEAASQTPEVSRAIGSMVGMAVGDSYGHMYEFLPVQDAPLRELALKGQDVPYFDSAEDWFHGESNAFGLQLGQWTDDSSMGLCMADSIIALGRFDGSDMRIRFWNWWNNGYCNAFGKDASRSSSVGLGGNIAKSIGYEECRVGEVPTPAYNAKTEDAGNGSLMRFAPIALFACGTAQLGDMARGSSYTTHPGIIAAEACAFHAYILEQAFSEPKGANPKQFLDRVCADYEKLFLTGKAGWGWDQMHALVASKPLGPTEACWDWKATTLSVQDSLRARGHSYNGYPVSAGYFGAYSMDGLAMALHAVYNNTTFEDTVSHAINLLGDADSTGSIAGQIAGALYGVEAIPPKWRADVQKWDDGEIALRAVLLWHLNLTVRGQ